MKQNDIPKKKMMIILCCTFLLCIVSVIYIYCIKNHPLKPIRSDGLGYYQYLPAMFNYHGDLTFSFVTQETAGENAEGLKYFDNNVVVNKYPIGTAVMEMPFYFIAKIYYSIIKGNSIGFEGGYQIAVLISTWVYLIIGLWFLYKILIRKFDENVVLITIIGIVYSTNLFHYATFDACFSHVYSFCVINIFIYLLMLEKDKWVRYFGIGIVGGLIVIIRNINIIILVLYLLWDVNNFKELRDRIRYVLNWRRIIPVISGGFIMALPQLLYWYTITGKFVLYSYGEESFSYLFPHLLNYLFSIAKGLFVWAPILFIALFGIKYLERYGFSKIAMLSILLMHTYLCSAWDCWQFGGSFGNRPTIDIYAIYAICLAALLQNLYNINIKFFISNGEECKFSFFSLFIPILIMFILINFRFMLGYWHGIIPYADTTTNDIMNCIQWQFQEMRQNISNWLEIPIKL